MKVNKFNQKYAEKFYGVTAKRIRNLDENQK